MKKAFSGVVSILLAVLLITMCSEAGDDSGPQPSDLEAEVFYGIFDTVFYVMGGGYESGISVSPSIPMAGYEPDVYEMIGNTYTVTATNFSPEYPAIVNGSITVTVLSFSESTGLVTISMSGTVSGGPFEGEDYTVSCSGAVVNIDTETGAGVSGSGSVSINGVSYTVSAIIAKIESMNS